MTSAAGLSLLGLVTVVMVAFRLLGGVLTIYGLTGAYSRVGLDL